jgi:hypothetical protein
MTNAEKWEDIKGYESLYQVSNNGKVRNKQTGKILKAGISGGYYMVALSKNNQAHSYTVHKLVMENFNREPYENEVINHIDSNKLNNNIDNLEYVTQKENVRKAWESGLCEGIRKHAKNMIHKNAIPCKAVAQKDLNGNLIATYVSVREAERKTGITSGQISHVCTGRIKATHNYIFEHIESEEML